MDKKKGALRALGVSLHPGRLMNSLLVDLDKCVAAAPSYAVAEALLENDYNKQKEDVADYVVAIVARLHCALISECRDDFLAHIGAIAPMVRDCEQRFPNAIKEPRSESDETFCVLASLAQVLHGMMSALPHRHQAVEARSVKIRETCFVLWLIACVCCQRGWCLYDAQNCVDFLRKSYLPLDHFQVERIDKHILTPLTTAVCFKTAASALWHFADDPAALGVLECVRKNPYLLPLQLHGPELQIRMRVEEMMQNNALPNDHAQKKRFFLALVACQERQTFTESETNIYIDALMVLLKESVKTSYTDEEKLQKEAEVMASLRGQSFRSLVENARFSTPRRIVCQYLAILFARHKMEPDCPVLRSCPYFCESGLVI